MLSRDPCAHLRQGHVFRDVDFGDGVKSYVIISQTCDVVLPKRPNIILAVVADLTDPAERAAAANRDNPRYLPLSSLGEYHFADLNDLLCVSREEVSPLSPTDGIDLQRVAEIRDFSLAVGRWFSRFAFEDDVVPWLRPLYDQVKKKYDKENSPLGRVLRDVVELRVEAVDWFTRPLELELHVIARAGSVPLLDEPPSPNPALRTKLYDDDLVKSPSEVATVLVQLIDTGDTANASVAWQALAESLAAICKPKSLEAAPPGTADAVRSIEAVLWSDDEFPLSRVRKSELLDLDYLSGSNS